MVPAFTPIVENIWLLKAPFPPVWTGILLIRSEKENILIDSGADQPEKYLIPALEGLGLSIRDVTWLLNTHCHGDHISGHYDLVNRYGLKTAVYEAGAPRLEDPAANAVRIRTRFPAFSPSPQSWLKGIHPDLVMKDREIFHDRLMVISTPGHDSDCVCWYDLPTKTIITGDSLQGNGTPTQGIGFYQSLEDYLYTLRTLMDLDIENIICGHEYDGIGDIILGRENVQHALQRCLDLTNTYRKRTVELYQSGIRNADQIAVKLIDEMGCGMPSWLFMPINTVVENLKDAGLEIHFSKGEN